MDSFPYVKFSHCIFPLLMLFQHIPTVLALHNHSMLNYNTLYYHSLPSCTIHVITDDKSSHSHPKRIFYGCFYKWVQLLYQNEFGLQFLMILITMPLKRQHQNTNVMYYFSHDESIIKALFLCWAKYIQHMHPQEQVPHRNAVEYFKKIFWLFKLGTT